MRRRARRSSSRRRKRERRCVPDARRLFGVEHEVLAGYEAGRDVDVGGLDLMPVVCGLGDAALLEARVRVHGGGIGCGLRSESEREKACQLRQAGGWDLGRGAGAKAGEARASYGAFWASSYIGLGGLPSGCSGLAGGDERAVIRAHSSWTLSSPPALLLSL